MEDHEAFAVLKGMELVEQALSAPKPQVDLGGDAGAERNAEALAKSQWELLFDAADDPEPVRRVK